MTLKTNSEIIKFTNLTHPVEAFAGEIGTEVEAPQIKLVGLKRRIFQEQCVADNCC